MSAVIGVTTRDGHVVIGADSAATGGNEIEQRWDPKVFKKENLVFGFAGLYRPGQIIRYMCDLDPYHGTDFQRWAVQILVPTLRSALADEGFDPAEENWGLLVASGDHLRRVSTDFSVAQTRDGVDAIGSGGMSVRAAYYATQRGPGWPSFGTAQVDVETALNATAQVHNDVMGPMVVETT